MSEFKCIKCGAIHTFSLKENIVTQPEKPVVMKKKIAFVIGHTSSDKGADSPYTDQEWDFWNKIYDTYLSDLGDRFHHNPNISSYTQRQKDTAVKTKDYDLVFEMHYNSSANPDANGCEVLFYHTNTKAKDMAVLFLDKLSSLTGIKNRGAKATSSGNGYGFLLAQKPTALLLEPFFGSNQSDVNRFKGEALRASILAIS